MKKIIALAAVLACITIFSSCLTTLQPLVSLDNIVTEDRITGTWQQDHDTVRIESMLTSRVIRQHPSENAISEALPRNDRNKRNFYSKMYIIIFTKNNIYYCMSAALTRIGGDLYMELSPMFLGDSQSPEGSGNEYSYNYLATFTIAKIKIESNKALSIQFLNGDYIKEQINVGNIRIKHEHDKLFDKMLITASTEELNQFLDKYGHDERLFSTKNSITLTRKG